MLLLRGVEEVAAACRINFERSSEEFSDTIMFLHSLFLITSRVSLSLVNNNWYLRSSHYDDEFIIPAPRFFDGLSKANPCPFLTFSQNNTSLLLSQLREHNR